MTRRFSGERLRDARIAAGLRPEEVAVLIGRSVYSIYQYERGRVVPGGDIIGALSATLDVPVDHFYPVGAVMSA